MFADFVSDNLLRGVLPEPRMPIERLVTKGLRDTYDPHRGPEVGYPGSDQHRPLVSTATRLEWMNAQGIAVQNVISGTGYTLTGPSRSPMPGCGSS
jgi:hypothetical protein